VMMKNIRYLGLVLYGSAIALSFVQPTSGYDRTAAVGYIEQWTSTETRKRNTASFHDYDVEGSRGGDCANFRNGAVVYI
jgi:hypothetical protein